MEAPAFALVNQGTDVTGCFKIPADYSNLGFVEITFIFSSLSIYYLYCSLPIQMKIALFTTLIVSATAATYQAVSTPPCKEYVRPPLSLSLGNRITVP